MRVISVAGSQKDAGKTSLTTFLLSHFKSFGALKVTVCAGICPRPNPCGVCVRLTEPFAIIEDETIINTPNTDTALFKQAGASKVIWVQATKEGLKEGVELALSKFEGIPGIITEGNNLIKAIEPSLSLMVLHHEETPYKQSAIEILDKIDALVIRQGATLSKLPDQLKNKPVFYAKDEKLINFVKEKTNEKIVIGD
ncbi:MAG: hypothetical protein ABIB65_02495 [Candidatus Margulisiibacteriota bacterium]